MAKKSVQPIREKVEEKPLEMSDLKRLIQDFYSHKDLAATEKKIADSINPKIKEVMKTLGITNYTDEEGFTATLGTQDRTTLNQDKVLAKLKALGLTEAITTIEVPNEDIIEDLIYTGKLEKTVFEDCLEISVIETLKVSKKKEKKATTKKGLLGGLL